ncbi:MAG: D-alanine--D-alanine ligase [Planctomycetaceae bacterium]|nr:D-alanine--D-alanine ligase [Planctomycetaceae bacterium]
MERRLTITVLLGGPSPERTISLASGMAVADALEACGHHVIRLDPNNGRPADCLAPADSGAYAAELIAEAEQTLQHFNWHGVDVAFNALHGPFGEDGRLQQLLNRLQVPYTGSGPEASHVGFHKELAKSRFVAAGVPTPQSVEVTAETPFTPDSTDPLGWPLVVKPSAQGSSLGVTIVGDASHLPDAIAKCLALGDRVLIEEYIPGTEWTVPVWDGTALPVIQIVPAVDFYDFSAKYADDRTTYRFEFDVDVETLERIAQTGTAAATTLGMQGLSRADIRLHPDGRVYVLEVNSSPGMTDHSLVPKSAARQGISLGELCEQECRRALHRRTG